jgi:hypothetical protein
MISTAASLEIWQPDNLDEPVPPECSFPMGAGATLEPPRTVASRALRPPSVTLDAVANRRLRKRSRTNGTPSGSLVRPCSASPGAADAPRPRQASQTCGRSARFKSKGRPFNGGLGSKRAVSSPSPSDRVEPHFGVLVLPDAPFPTLFERWTHVEELGFDFLFAPDHARHTRDPSIPWFDGLTVVAAMALRTNTIRIGTLVANPICRVRWIRSKGGLRKRPSPRSRAGRAV